MDVAPNSSGSSCQIVSSRVRKPREDRADSLNIPPDNRRIHNWLRSSTADTTPHPPFYDNPEINPVEQTDIASQGSRAKDPIYGKPQRPSTKSTDTRDSGVTPSITRNHSKPTLVNNHRNPSPTSNFFDLVKNAPPNLATVKFAISGRHRFAHYDSFAALDTIVKSSSELRRAGPNFVTAVGGPTNTIKANTPSYQGPTNSSRINSAQISITGVQQPKPSRTRIIPPQSRYFPPSQQQNQPPPRTIPSSIRDAPINLLQSQSVSRMLPPLRQYPFPNSYQSKSSSHIVPSYNTHFQNKFSRIVPPATTYDEFFRQESQSLSRQPPASLPEPHQPGWFNPETIVYDVLFAAGLLNADGNLDSSKLDIDGNLISPQPVRDPESRLVAIPDSSDNDNKTRTPQEKDTRGPEEAMSTASPKRVERQSSENIQNGQVRRPGLQQAQPTRDYNATPRQSSQLRNTITVEPSNSFSIVIPSPGPSAAQTSPARFNSHSMEIPSIHKSSSVARIERLKGKSTGFRVEIPGSLAPALTSSLTSNGKKRGRPFATPEGAAKAAAKTYSHHTPIPTILMTVKGKKRGRPFANPENAAARAAKMPKTAQSAGTPKKKGRPFTKPIFIPPGHFIPFVCEWKGCLAELINLENLRKHVYIVHGHMNKSSGIVVCRWGKCAAKHEEGVIFEGKEEWKDHIEDSHLVPFSWHMGDGPKDDSSTFSPRLPTSDLRLTQPWLFDAEGIQVTPLVDFVNTEKGSALERNKRRYQQELYLSRKARGETATPEPRTDTKYRGMNISARNGFSPNSASVSVVIPSSFIRPGDYMVVDDSDEDELATAIGEMGVIEGSGDETNTC